MNIRDELEEVVRHSYIVDSVATSMSNDMGDLMDAVYRLRCCAERAMAELNQLEGKNKKDEKDQAAEAAMEGEAERREKSGSIGHYGGLPDRGW